MVKIPEDYLPPKELWPVFEVPPEYKVPDKINLAEELLDINIKQGRTNNVAIYFQDQKITYRELYINVNKLANSLRELGVEENDRVGLRTANIPQAIVANFAIMKVGAIPVPMSPLWSAKELTYASNNAELKAMFVTYGLIGEVERSMKELGGFKTCKYMIVIGAKPEEIKPKGYYSYEELVAKGAKQFEPVRRDKRDIGLLLYTSGTTGDPKGCAHFQEGALILCDMVGKQVWKLTPSDVVGGSAPVSFAAGYGTFALIPYRFGAAVSLLLKFVPEELLADVEKHGITVFTGLPTAYRKFLTMPDWEKKYDLSSIRMYTTGGEALGGETFEAWLKRTGMPIYEGLGATEMVHLVLSNAVTMKPKAKSCGVPLKGLTVRIVDDDGKPCKPGEIGTMTIRGPTGIVYWRPTEHGGRLMKKQKESVKNGWNVLGDYVYADEEGYIYFVSRDDDMIKSSGYRIGPEEVEEVIAKHPKVADVGVIGVPHPVRGMDVKAWVQLKPDIPVPTTEEAKKALEQEILNFMRDKIAVYKLPRLFEFTHNPLPRTPTGKLIRRFIRDWEKAKEKK
ncbi:MAG: acyl-CoA synthetase [Methanocellales archaeon]